MFAGTLDLEIAYEEFVINRAFCTVLILYLKYVKDLTSFVPMALLAYETVDVETSLRYRSKAQAMAELPKVIVDQINS